MIAGYSHIRATDWEVGAVPFPDAKQLVRRLHYSHGTGNTAIYCHGLMPKDECFLRYLKGAALWMPPIKAAAINITEDWQGVLCLSRLVVADDMPTNAASFLLGRSIRLIDRQRWPVLVTYADEWRGHKGTIYEATNWGFAGYTKPERRYVKAGRLVCRKAGPKTRTHQEMLDLGCQCIGAYRCKRFVLPSQLAVEIEGRNGHQLD